MSGSDTLGRVDSVPLEEEAYRALFHEAPIAYREVDCRGAVLRVNDAALRLFGLDRGGIIGKFFWDLISPAERDEAREDFLKRVSGQGPLVPFTAEYIGRGGRRITLEAHESLVLDKSGTALGVRSALIDITERRHAVEALRASEERYALAVRGASDGLWDWNFKSGDIYFSPRWKALLGYEEKEIGSNPEEWFTRVHPEDLGRLKIEISLHMEGHRQNFAYEHRMRHRDGTWRWMLARGISVPGAEGRAERMVGSQTDITMRKLAEERLLHDAFHDDLTDLPNRALFMERLERAKIRAMRRQDYLFAVLFFDLDGFKLVNDSVDHQAGDELLVGIARRLEACLRPQDTVARLGGDEFAILLDELKGEQDATQLAERIQREIRAPFQVGKRQVYTSASIGIALSSDGSREPERLLRDADTAMYRAKALGKAQYAVFHAGLHARAVERLRLETDLRQALEREELRVFYQPIVHAGSGKIAGLEALLRWAHPSRGLLGPARFIAVAEDTGLIIPIGDWVLQTACAQVRCWQAARISKLRLAVNLSPRQFSHPSLVETISRVLQQTALDAGDLDLELKESTALGSGQEVLDTLRRLCSLGVRISIDDFGTGYSSLKYLRRFPITTLKIDGSFVRDAATDPESAAIAAAAISLGQGLKLNVVAEGIETLEQMKFLHARGCEYIQGRIFSDPLAAAEMTELLSFASLKPCCYAATEPNPVNPANGATDMSSVDPEAASANPS
jgi:diguanylate cyclase (GGDEF)-like protein/PAS domain S-box-containing protein